MNILGLISQLIGIKTLRLTDPIPELEECYALVHREYVRHTTMK